MSDFFKFEDESIDFPFYNQKPQLSIKQWSLLLLGLIVEILLIFGFGSYIPFYNDLPNVLTNIISILILFGPLYYCCRKKIGLIIKKPTLNDLKVDVICYILFLIVSPFLSFISRFLTGELVSHPSSGTTPDVLITVINIFMGLMSEELVKVISLLLVMGLIYYFTTNRKTSVIVAIIVSCTVFGLLHLPTYGFNVIQCLIAVGAACIIHLYPYLKTKNIVNSYITHVLIDLTLFLPLFLSLN